MKLAVVTVLCMFVLCVAVRNACCANFSSCIDGEWTRLRQLLVHTSCAEKLVEQSLLDFFRSEPTIGDTTETDVQLCKLFVRLTAMLISKDRRSDICVEEGVIDHEMRPLSCAKTTDIEHLAAALQREEDPILSATAEVLQNLKDPATCEITCTPGLSTALCNGIVRSARRLVTMNQSNAGGNRKLLSEDSDFKNAFQKNFPVSNEQIDAFNRGQREFIDAQLKVLTLEHEEIQQQVEKARLELLEDEDYTTYMQISPAAVALPSQLAAVKEDRTYSYLLVVLVVVVLVLVIYWFGRWKAQHSGKMPQQRKSH